MPTMADIIVKKADGSTNVTYSAVAGSAGDKAPALWRSKTVGTTVAEQPSLLVSASDNGPRTARRVNVNFSWPVVAQDAGGNKVITGRMSGSVSVLVPQNQDAAIINEQGAQFANLIGSAIMASCFKDGFAPRS